MKRAALALLLALCCSAAWASSFTYVGFYNGTNPADTSTDQLFSQPTGLLYAYGNLYVSDAGRNALYAMSPDYVLNASPRLRYINSQGTDGSLSNPMRMAFDNGLLYVADGTSGRIKYYNGVGFGLSEWNSATNVGRASGVAMDNSSFYITDQDKGRLMVYSRSTKAYWDVGIGSGGSDGLLSAPSDVRIYGGDFYVSDAGKNEIFAYDGNLTYLYSIGNGRGGVTLSSPEGIKIYDNRIYVADKGNNRVVVFTMDGYPIEILSSSPAANFSRPQDVEVADGYLYVADTGNGMVQIFSINYTAGNDSVMQAIQAANYTVAQLQELQQAADLLGVSYSNVSFASDLASAQQDYTDMLYSSAASSAQRVSSSAGSAQADIASAIDVKARQVSKDAQDAVAPYRDAAGSLGLSSALSAFDNQSAQLLSSLSLKDYLTAAREAVALGKAGSGFAAQAQQQQAMQNAQATGQVAGQLEGMKIVLAGRLAAVENQSVQYNQTADFSDAEKLLAQAETQIAGGDFGGANSTLSQASFEISSFESSLSSSAKDISDALANISSTELSMNLSEAKPMLLPADLGAERSLMEQARSTAYSNPQLGISMAQQALASATSKIGEAQTLSLAAAALLVMLGVIGALAAVFYIHLRHRRRQLEAAAERARKREERRK